MELYKKIIEMWKSYNIQETYELDKYLDNFRILFAFNSGKIENTEISYSDTREIFENGNALNFTGNPRTLFEQQNQKTCYEYLKNKIIENELLTVGLIKETHKILTTGTYDEQRFIKNREAPGDFKKHDSVIGINEVGVAADNVEKEILDLISKLNNYNKEDTLKAGSYFHAKFEYIHPFADGNGRVGRTLLNYYLLTHNHPPLIIFNDDKNLYYECLNKYDETEDINSLYSFLIHQTEKTWEKTYLNFKNH